MSRTRIAVDMDEVIADALSAQRQWLLESFGYQWNEEELEGKRIKALISEEHSAALEMLLHAGDFFGDLSIIHGAQTALAHLNDEYDIFITSAAMEYPASLQYKRKWLTSNFSFLKPLNFVFCGDKSIIKADFLIDDNSRHFEQFCGQGILFSSPHNAKITGYPRLDKWSDAEDLLTQLRRS